MTQHRLITILFLLVFADGLDAVLPEETFDYPDGPLVTANAGKWTTHSGNAGEVAVIAGRAFVADANTEDVNTSLSQTFAPESGATLYARFTLNCAKLPSTSGDYFAHFLSSATNVFRAKVFALTQGAAPGSFRLGLANLSNAPNAVLALDLTTNVTYTVIVRYDVSNALSTLWVDPAAESAPGITDPSAPAATTITAFALRQTTGMGNHFLDDLVVGTNFNDVLLLTPPTVTTQPASTTANYGALVSFTVTATGTFPIRYQWEVDGTPIPAATNTTLTLTNVTLADARTYWATISNPAGTTNSEVAVLTVNPPPAANAIKLVHYNLQGNFASDWTTNAPQVQAIARSLQHLDPDIITLNEIPNGLRHEMTNWMTAFFPTYNLAISPGTDGAIRNGIISRYPILAFNSLLTRSGLTNFGYDGLFTRDLFEAQLSVPAFPAPLHVFVVHLKSGQGSDDSARRAAEANAISNYFVTGFLSTNAGRAYLLAGDLNEDIVRPPASNPQSIERLISPPTGLRLITPLNPLTASELTFSIQSPNGLSRRYDYLLPCGLIYSNLTASQVFRSDLLSAPPPPLLPTDSFTASDHLPVVLVFNNPYDPPFRLLSVSAHTGQISLTWESVSNRVYAIEVSADLNAWGVLASNLTSTGTNLTFATNAPLGPVYFRVSRSL